MPIPASQIVQVNPRLITPGGSDLEFNGLMLSSSGVIPLSQFVLSFSSADDVGAYFGLDSQEYALAQIYFLGYDDSFSKPTSLFFAPRIAEAQAAFVRGGAITQTLAQLKTLSDGQLTITLGGQQTTVTVNFSSANAFSDIAQLVQSALQAKSSSGEAFTAATCTYSSTFNAFTITSGQAGADDGLVYPSGTLADALNMTQAAGAVLSAGSAALTPAENMAAIVNETQNFVCFMSIDQLDEDDAVAFSTWANAQGVEYLHVYWDNNVQLTQSNPSGTIAQAIEAANLSSTCAVYNSAEYAAFILGIAASVDYDRTNGTITFKFKGQSGVAANVQNGTIASALEANGMNFVGNYATRNDTFVFLSPGQMFGEYQWIDTYLNAVWLNNALQVACMNGFAQNARVPYTEEGYTLIKAWMQDPINRALKSGIIDPGVTLSEAQKAQLQQEAGLDISSQLNTDGYYVQVLDPAPAVRQQRGTPQCSLWYTYGGAVHKLEIASTAVV